MRLIEVREYDEEWPSLYGKEAGLLSGVLGDNVAGIEHIGSTSVPGLAAKPTIDIMVTVQSLQEVDSRNSELADIGYQAYGEYGISGRRYFVKRRHVEGKGWLHIVHVHIFHAEDNDNIWRHTAVREYLKSHEGRAREYTSLKLDLASRFQRDPDGYSAGKEEFMKRLQLDALEWCGKRSRIRR